MTLTQLKYAITVANAASMNEASWKLFVSRPSLSTSMKELEEEIRTFIQETYDGAMIPFEENTTK